MISSDQFFLDAAAAIVFHQQLGCSAADESDKRGPRGASHPAGGGWCWPGPTSRTARRSRSLARRPPCPADEATAFHNWARVVVKVSRSIIRSDSSDELEIGGRLAAPLDHFAFDAVVGAVAEGDLLVGRGRTGRRNRPTRRPPRRRLPRPLPPTAHRRPVPTRARPNILRHWPPGNPDSLRASGQRCSGGTVGLSAGRRLGSSPHSSRSIQCRSDSWNE